MIIAVCATAVDLRITRFVVFVSFVFLLDRTHFLSLIFFHVAYYVAYNLSSKKYFYRAPAKDLPAKILWEEETQRSEKGGCVSNHLRAEFAATKCSSLHLVPLRCISFVRSARL